MSKSLFILANEPRSGKSLIALGFMQMLTRKMENPAFFRPIVGSGRVPDHDASLLRGYFNLSIPLNEMWVHTLREAMLLLGSGSQGQLMEDIITRFKELEKKYDFVLCEGTDIDAGDAALEQDINVDIAANLGAPVLAVINGHGKTEEEAANSVQLTYEAYVERGLNVLAVVVNRFGGAFARTLKRCLDDKDSPPPIFVIPTNNQLNKPSMREVRDWLGAKVLYGGDRMDALAGEYLVAAMRVEHFLEYVTENSLVVTPGDRSDIVLGALASRASDDFPNMAGLILTGGMDLKPTIDKVLKGWREFPLPILLVEDHTYMTVKRLEKLYPRIQASDGKKIERALRTFEANVDAHILGERLASSPSSKTTPRMFEYGLIQRAKENKRRIVFCEGEVERILRASDALLRRDVVDIAILGKEDEMRRRASMLGLHLGRAEIINPTDFPEFDDYAKTLFELRKHKGLTEEKARDLMADRTYFGTMMVYKQRADAMISGATNSTADTIRPALQFIKTKPGISIVSSVFFMCLKDRVLVYGDCAVNPDPNAEELAQIAISSARTAAQFGIEPKVAMLSYSTGVSGKGKDVDKVREATEIVRKTAPELAVEGPIQYDAAIDPVVAAEKMPESKVAGHATVFIFPDLDTGNNTYKAVQRSAGAIAMGPVLQGLNKPVLDLSRGCTVQDIIYTAAIAAILSQETAS